MGVYQVSEHFIVRYKKVVKYQVVEQEVDKTKKVQTCLVWVGTLWYTTTMYILQAEVEYTCFIILGSVISGNPTMFGSSQKFSCLVHNSRLQLKFVPHDMIRCWVRLVLSYGIVVHSDHHSWRNKVIWKLFPSFFYSEKIIVLNAVAPQRNSFR